MIEMGVPGGHRVWKVCPGRPKKTLGFGGRNFSKGEYVTSQITEWPWFLGMVYVQPKRAPWFLGMECL